MATAAGHTDENLNLQLLRAASASAPGSVEVLVELGQALERAVTAGASACTGARRATCLGELSSIAIRIRDLDRLNPAWVEFSSRVSELEGNKAVAAEILASNCRSVRAPGSCIARQFDLKSRPINEIAEDLRQTCGNADACAAAERAIARAYADAGWLREALGPLRRAAQLERSAFDWLNLARAAVQAGELGEAGRALRKVREQQPDNPQIRVRANEIQKALDDAIRDVVP
jgi:tetratricopeptide (TPR) repeat protein